MHGAAQWPGEKKQPHSWESQSRYSTVEPNATSKLKFHAPNMFLFSQFMNNNMNFITMRINIKFPCISDEKHYKTCNRREKLNKKYAC